MLYSCSYMLGKVGASSLLVKEFLLRDLIEDDRLPVVDRVVAMASPF